MTDREDDVIILGAGIGGLTLALMLHRAGIPCRVYEAAPEIKQLGVGIQLLPHAAKELCLLGLEQELANLAVTTKEIAYYNRFGQRIFGEPSGRFGGYEWPQFSMHRADLQFVLLDAFRARAGMDKVITAHKSVAVEQTESGVTVHFEHPITKERLESVTGSIAIVCEGIHSVIRKQFFPHEGPPRESGVTMWRGTTVYKPYLTGASMVRMGWLDTAKVLIYPIRNNVDDQGNQLLNWVVDIHTPGRVTKRDWNNRGRLEDFIDAVKDWHFDWLDVPDVLRRTEAIFEFPMVDQDPLPRWTHGRVTLMGDAAHPMYPRGANGGAQSILDARALSDRLASLQDWPAALMAYEAERLPITTQIVLTNRKDPPDAILREVHARTGDKPFNRIEDIISHAELEALSVRYQRIAGFDKERLASAG